MGRGILWGLSGEHIPVECRILAIADAYDAMTTDRPYRKAMTREAAIAELSTLRRNPIRSGNGRVIHSGLSRTNGATTGINNRDTRNTKKLPPFCGEQLLFLFERCARARLTPTDRSRTAARIFADFARRLAIVADCLDLAQLLPSLIRRLNRHSGRRQCRLVPFLKDPTKMKRSVGRRVCWSFLRFYRRRHCEASHQLQLD